MKKQNQFNSILLIMIWLMQALPAQAASFDCGKAKTEIEKLICSNAKLSKLDEEMATAYREAIKRVTALDNEKATVERYRSFQEAGEKVVTYTDYAKFHQQRWLKERVFCETTGCLKELYAQRIAALKNDVGGGNYSVHGREQIYRYKLEQNQDNQVCSHMLNVYNKNFKEPWNNQKFPRVKLEGYFQRMPSVDYNQEIAQKMIYSRFPTSTEFELINWQEGRAFLDTKPEDRTLYPLLVANLDIDNDGSPEIVFKSSFMYWFAIQGLDADDMGDGDRLTIYPAGGFHFNGIVDLGDIRHGQQNGYKPRDIEARQLRPFILNRTVYISRYETVYAENDELSMYGRPMEQYIYIQKYLSGGDKASPGKYIAPNMKTICRFQMFPKP